MNYILEFKELFEKCIKQEKDREITIFQGKGYTQSFGGLVDYFRKEDEGTTKIYLDKLLKFIECNDFKEQIVLLKKNNIIRENEILKTRIRKGPNNIISQYRFVANEKLLHILDWNWLKTNFYENFSIEFPTIISDWKIYLLDDLYKEYKREKSSLYEYSSENPLSKFYATKGIDLKMNDNYGLFPVLDDFVLKANGIPKIYDTKNDTHIIIKFVPNDFVRYIADLKSKFDFDVAFRPDYELCGEHIKDLSLIMEGVVFGKAFDTYISELPPLSELADYEQSENRLVIKKEIKDLTFEELVDDFEVYGDYIVTQVVHLQFEMDYGKEFITHLDHEYVFYDIDSYDLKQSNLTTKGSARKKFKTFKIDNAKIEFTIDANSNIVFQTLKAFFKNDELINEYFEQLIQSSLKIDN